jgi:hypothetical protein
MRGAAAAATCVAQAGTVGERRGSLSRFHRGIDAIGDGANVYRSARSRFLFAISGFGINHPTSAAINRLWAWI